MSWSTFVKRQPPSWPTSSSRSNPAPNSRHSGPCAPWPRAWSSMPPRSKPRPAFHCPSGRALLDRMKRARYGVIFFGPSSPSTVDAHQTCHAIFALTRDMNAHARFVCVPLGESRQCRGGRQCFDVANRLSVGRQPGRGYPRFNPGEYTTAQILERGEADAALIIAGDPMSHLGDRAREHLGRIPTIVLDPVTTATTRDRDGRLPHGYYRNQHARNRLSRRRRADPTARGRCIAAPNG